MRWREEQTLTVSALNRAVRLGLESEWGDVWVVGEIANCKRVAAGHVYFTLCDDVAQIQVVMFRSDAQRSRAKLDTGARVRVRGSLTLYEARGNFQLVARAAVPAGDGDRDAQMKKLIAKLDLEGLLAKERKRPLPSLPRCIGLVTSDHGAAVHDVIRVASERCPVRIVVAPCLVQGAEAAASIVRALELVQRLPELDVVIVARGGGASEDLWAFNEEIVARAIARCRVPVVSGIGHEVDTTVADLVADVRAATPSNAAEVVVPDRDALEEQLRSRVRMLERAMDSRIDREQLVLSRLLTRLEDPRRLLRSAHTALTDAETRLGQVMRKKLARAHGRIESFDARLSPHDPRKRLSAQRAALMRARTRLELSPQRWLAPRSRAVTEAGSRAGRAMRESLLHARHDVARNAGRLEALSPLAVLSRGYAIAFSERTSRALRNANEASPGERLRIRLGTGELRARVEDDER